MIARRPFDLCLHPVRAGPSPFVKGVGCIVDETNHLASLADLYATLPTADLLDLHRLYLRSADDAVTELDRAFVLLRLALLEDELIRRGQHHAAVANILGEES